VIEIQRARLVAAMVEVSAERGAGNVTVAHVVDCAGVSRRTFYEIFRDRQQCFLAAFDEGIKRASRYVLDAYDPEVGWSVRVRTALTGLLSFLDVECGMGRLLIVESLGAGAHAFERRQRVLAQAIALIDEGRKQAREDSELSMLTAEGIVGGVLSVLHSRLLVSSSLSTVGDLRMRGMGGGSLLELTGPLMSMIVLPYLGPAAARRELSKPVPEAPAIVPRSGGSLGRLEMRLTYRTVRVLLAVAAGPGGSNRAVADRAGIGDQGQISKLLSRLEGLGLVANTGTGPGQGAPNAWTLTQKGEEVHGALATQS
jgi:AcrR family transcriptional regulator